MQTATPLSSEVMSSCFALNFFMHTRNIFKYIILRAGYNNIAYVLWSTLMQRQTWQILAKLLLHTWEIPFDKLTAGVGGLTKDPTVAMGSVKWRGNRLWKDGTWLVCFFSDWFNNCHGIDKESKLDAQVKNQVITYFFSKMF